MDLDATKSLIEMWWRNIWAGDYVAMAAGAACVIGGYGLTSLGKKLGGRGAYSLARLGWRGAAWLFRPKPQKPWGEVARAIRETMSEQPAGLNAVGDVTYGDYLVVRADPGHERIFVRGVDPVDAGLVTKEEKKAICKSASRHRADLQRAQALAALTLKDAQSVDFDVCS